MQTILHPQIPEMMRPALRLLCPAILVFAAQAAFAQAVATPAQEPAANDKKKTIPIATGAAEPAKAKAADSEATIVLSPFEVTADSDTGYAASSTLAGNRLNTNLRDVGSAITVVTSQFLKDIGANSNESLLQYTTNTEVGNIYGNMANAGSGTQLDETRTFVAPNTNTRVRGLASADNTLDFFLTDIPWDGYNVDRVEFQRGPNAILFGLGSPAGIINAGSKQAGFKTQGSLEVRYSKFDSLRTSLDYNQVIVPKQLAARINLLRNDEKFQQEPSFQRDQRGAAAIRYEPGFVNKGSAHTTFKATFEKGNIRSNRPRTIPPGDAITPWFYTGTANGFTATGDPFVYLNPGRTGFDARGLQDGNIAATLNPDRGQFPATVTINGVAQPNPNFQPWLGGQFAAGYFGNPMAIFNSAGSVQYGAWEPNTRNGIGTNGNIDGSIAGIPFSRMSTITGYRDYARKINLPGAKFGLTRNLLITDPSIFDIYNKLIDGPNKGEWQNFHHYDLNFSQTFFRGNAGVEAVYDRQSYDNGQLVLMTDKAQTMNVDPMRVFPDGTINPNFGRVFIADNIGSSRATVTERESGRVTGFVKYDFEKGERRNLITRILGHHVFTGFVNNERRFSDSRGFLHYGTDLAYKDTVVGPATVANIDSTSRAIYPVLYFGPSLANRTSAVGANLGGADYFAVPTNGQVRYFDSTWAPAAGINPGDAWVNTDYPVGNSRRNSTQSENPANYKGWVNTPIKVLNSEDGYRDQLTTNGQLTKNTVASKSVVWNGYFWNGALIGMYGLRRDTSKAWSYSGVRNPSSATSDGTLNLDPSVYKLPEAYRDRIDQTSKSYSLVAHLPKFLRREWLPFDVSLFYNKSDNFAASAGRVGPLNDPLGPPRGNTKDYGAVFSTKDGKYTFKVNRYESRVQNANSTGGINPFYLSQFFTTYAPWNNVFKYKIDGNLFNLSGTQGNDPNRWTWQPAAGQTADQALANEAASIVAWDKMIASIPRAFFDAYQIKIDTIDTLTATTPAGLTITEDNLSKGYEFELTAQPVRNLRLSFNASKAEAVRSNVGEPSLVNLVDIINKALNGTAAGLMRTSAAGTSTDALTAWNNNFFAQYAPVKFQEGSAVTELRKWRANMTANYDFREGLLKNFSLGTSVRWQDKVVIGYVPIYLDFQGKPAANPQVATVWRPDLDKPFYGPAETNIDAWVGYKHRLSKKVNFRSQINVRNIGKRDGLIPITVQPDGTPVGERIAPTMVWSLTNTFEF